jgi:ribosomal protein S18 acetylase RimI-like enzyme
MVDILFGERIIINLTGFLLAKTCQVRGGEYNFDMTKFKFAINSNPAAQDVAFLEDQIIEFNYAATGFRDGEGLSIFVRNEQDEIVAGISGFTWGGYCKIEWLWVHADCRHRGYGKHMMLAVEEEARARSCFQIVVDTHSFQAPGFYHKLGYETVGVMDDCPRGHQVICLKKNL